MFGWKIISRESVDYIEVLPNGSEHCDSLSEAISLVDCLPNGYYDIDQVDLNKVYLCIVASVRVHKLDSEVKLIETRV
jgi:hypothetical protein